MLLYALDCHDLHAKRAGHFSAKRLNIARQLFARWLFKGTDTLGGAQSASDGGGHASDLFAAT